MAVTEHGAGEGWGGKRAPGALSAGKQESRPDSEGDTGGLGDSAQRLPVAETEPTEYQRE